VEPERSVVEGPAVSLPILAPPVATNLFEVGISYPNRIVIPPVPACRGTGA
jgi:hypothetical protein